MKQSFRPESVAQKTIKSQNVRTPGLDKLHHSFLVRALVVERIRCLLDDVPFNDHPRAIIEKFLTIPPHYKEQDQQERYIQSEMLEIMEAFRRYEETPCYQEDLKALVPYKGHIWHLVSATASGVLLTIEV